MNPPQLFVEKRKRKKKHVCQIDISIYEPIGLKQRVPTFKGLLNSILAELILHVLYLNDIYILSNTTE